MLNGSDIAIDLFTEKQILGALFVESNAIALVPNLEPDHLFDLKHRFVFQAARNIEAKAGEVTITKIEAQLADEGNLQALSMYGRDPLDYLRHLVESAPVAVTPEVMRGLEVRLRELHAERERVINATQAPRSAPLITIGDALEQLVNIGKAPVYTTPFPTLNEALGFGGLLGGQPFTLAAGTGRGKTSFVGQLAMHHAVTGDVLIAIYEAFPGYNVARMAAGPLRTHSNAIIRDVGKYGGTILRTLPSRIYFLDRPSLSRIREATAQLAQKAGAAPLVIVDYGQKLADQVQSQQWRPDARLAMSETSAGLLDIAATTGAPVLTVSAVSRMSGRRTQDPRKLPPFELVDVAKESGAIEYDSAGLIVLSLSDECEGDERIATITVAKARFGEECHIEARFNGRTGEWRDLGRAERARPTKTPDVSIRDKLLSALRSGPAESATALIKRAQVNRNEGFAEVRALQEDGIVMRTDNGLEVAP